MGFGCETLESFNYSNFNNSVCYITVAGIVPAKERDGSTNATAGDIAFYQHPVVADDPGTFPIGQMFSGAREKLDGFNTLGNVNSSAQGNEIVSEQTTSLTFRADTVYDAMNPEKLPSTVNRNALVAMNEGSMIEDNSIAIELMGMSGNRLQCPVVMYDLVKYATYKDGYEVIDGMKKDSVYGAPSTKKNPYIDKYNKTTLCSMMELAIAPTSVATDDVVYRFPYVNSQNVQLTTADDANNFSMDSMFLADRRNGNQLMRDGFSLSEVDEVSITLTDTIYKVNADYIIEVSGGGAPTVTATAGEIAIVIDTADDTVEIYKYSTTWSADAVTSTMGIGFVAHTSNYCTALDCTSFESSAGDVYFMSVKTAGTTGSAIAAKNGTQYGIPYKVAITDDINRTVQWENYNI